MIVCTLRAPPQCLIKFAQISIFIDERRIIISVCNYADYVSAETCEVKDYVTSETTRNKGQLLCLFFATCLYFEILIMFIWDANVPKEATTGGGCTGE